MQNVVVTNENNTDVPVIAKVSWISRFLSILIDLLLIFFGTFALQLLIMNTPLANNYNAYLNRAQDIQDIYKLETGYGYKSYITEENPKPSNYLLHEDEIGQYYVCNYDDISDDVKNDWYNKVSNDTEYKEVTFYYQLHGYAIMIGSAAIIEAITLLLIPLTNKRKASVGKLVTASRLINPKYYGSARWYNILGRFAWVLIIDTAIPIIFLGQYAIVVAPVLMFIVSLLNRKTGRALVDLVSGTMQVPYIKQVKINKDDDSETKDENTLAKEE